MTEMEGTIEKMLLPQPFRFFDSHGHPGLEKKGIMERPGCFDMWAGNTVGARSLMGTRAFLGDPNPTKIITKPEECPNLTPETFIAFMDSANVEAMCLQCIHGISDPYPGNKDGWKWYVPNEYVKKNFIDAFPGRIFKGKVTEIGSSALQRNAVSSSTQESKDFKVVVTLEDPSKLLKPGLSASADIITARKSDALAVVYTLDVSDSIGRSRTVRGNCAVFRTEDRNCTTRSRASRLIPLHTRQ